jgi:hypothetical protein
VMLRTKRTQNINIVKLCLVSILEFNRKKHVLIVETTDRTSYAAPFMVVWIRERKATVLVEHHYH